ncbi:MAG: hypothetical protein IPQ05_15305 [Leptospiraceae bacterium]|nr:hypothetical protein [Leptospiraceae bacterium]MBK7058004.1 hypothetical protein [Leptospiraceae bacterium]MBK9501851.1 hypothetical protein [Leptospiraceae bacterium]MBL0265188.1 hypothetical protein [Leptospiraceae bacterium]
MSDNNLSGNERSPSKDHPKADKAQAWRENMSTKRKPSPILSASGANLFAFLV